MINVEASHTYPQVPLFLAEVERVLRPGGQFLYTDLRPRQRIPEWEATVANAPMRLVSKQIIDEEFVRGLEANSPRMEDIINRRVPKLLRGLACDEIGVKGGRLYQAAQNGEFSYRMYCFAKD